LQNLYQFNLGKWQKARGLARMQSRMQLFAFWNLKNRFYRSQTRRNFRVWPECNQNANFCILELFLKNLQPESLRK